ncbi:MAG: pyrroloquinoline quinone-dependent dehydrogenase [Myxococcota bacterium]
MPRPGPARWIRLAACCAALACGAAPLPEPGPVAGVSEWPSFGGDPGGTRHVVQDAIGRDDVGRLRPAWTYRHGDVSDGTGDVRSTTAFENTPILVEGVLYLCTPFNRVVALDPASGVELWAFDPEIDLTGRYANQLVCRGVSTWLDASAQEGSRCRRTLFTGTNDARLFALDAATGIPCPGFGTGGEVDLNAGPGPQRWQGEYQVTSPPAVVGDVVVVGSAVSDNARIDAPSGVVRGFDARTGELRWAWDLAPPGFDYASGLTSEAGYALGTPNVWAPMSVDEERGLVFVPTGNAAPDYYRGERHRMSHYGSSVVALRGATGEVAWHFQTVHDDLWDFDVPSQPTLARIDVDGEGRDALVQSTKMGLLFVLDRETGEPLHPVEERPVPTAGAPPGEVLSPTQPFPRIPMLVRGTVSADDAWGVTPWDRGRCREAIETLRFDGMYTPPSVQGTIMLPGNAGGSNWGGIAVDPDRQLAIVRSSDVPWVVTLIPRDDFEAARAARPGVEHGPQLGTPYGLSRELLLSPLGLPCIGPPWGTLAAVDLRSGDVRWQVPHGSIRDLAPVPLPLDWGVPGTGGPIVTSGGLVFIAGAMDDYLRAYDVETGEELWKGRLPAGGQATPMSYRVAFQDGSARQYVVIAAGGHARAGTTLGDHLVAFAIEE